MHWIPGTFGWRYELEVEKLILIGLLTMGGAVIFADTLMWEPGAATETLPCDIRVVVTKDTRRDASRMADICAAQAVAQDDAQMAQAALDYALATGKRLRAPQYGANVGSSQRRDAVYRTYTAEPYQTLFRQFADKGVVAAAVEAMPPAQFGSGVCDTRSCRRDRIRHLRLSAERAQKEWRFRRFNHMLVYLVMLAGIMVGMPPMRRYI